MEIKVFGLHHITAIAGAAQRNYDFYSKIVGLRLVKKTVNFDDPNTYHFYFGDELGSPGTILTFFPWEGIMQGRLGTGMATRIGYSVPKGSLEFWTDRFTQFNVKYEPLTEEFGESCLYFEDPDGLKISLVIPTQDDPRKPWETVDVKSNSATRGFHHIVLTLNRISETAKILTDLLGYRLLTQEGNRFRFITDAIDQACLVDLVEQPDILAGHVAAGSVHHVAFRVKDEDILMKYREIIAGKGIYVTPKIDRDYFFSIYFREPGGVLFELATENPGFSVDEPIAELGHSLRLPKKFEPIRDSLVKALPEIVY